ncbi:hypothetical protein GCM10023317_41020 [Actinopolymorpha pittospori]
MRGPLRLGVRSSAVKGAFAAMGGLSQAVRKAPAPPYGSVSLERANLSFG